jgi:hypothetical protein
VNEWPVAKFAAGRRNGEKRREFCRELYLSVLCVMKYFRNKAIKRRLSSAQCDNNYQMVKALKIMPNEKGVLFFGLNSAILPEMEGR